MLYLHVSCTKRNHVSSYNHDCNFVNDVSYQVIVPSEDIYHLVYKEPPHSSVHF